ncbi:MAG TPA: transcriptional regulator, partial [Deltaproteobacteria bacterium]|nr:transcriptional regulator [Deltaproteobacteria bacterium]
MNERKEIGLTIRKHRRALDITQTQLGETVGLGASSICQIEKGTLNFTIKTLLEISKA